ncbi:MAG: hypothetical protein K8J09_10740, partial [Planctomycetes bacterium]|nr:hypothetical protein [Planctomycetota bacterium]
ALPALRRLTPFDQSARDAVTLSLLHAGDPEGLDRLLADHGGVVLASLRQRFAEELDEGDLEEALTRASAIAWGAGGRHGGSESLRAWFSLLAHNCAQAMSRERRRDPMVYLADLDVAPAPGHGNSSEDDASNARSSLLLDVHKCLQELTDQQQAVLRADLEHGGRAPAERLAQELACSLDAVYAARTRGRRRLCQLLERLGHRVQGSRSQRPGARGPRLPDTQATHDGALPDATLRAQNAALTRPTRSQTRRST